MADETSTAASVYRDLRPRCTRLFKLDPGLPYAPLSGVIAPLHLFHSPHNNDHSKADSWKQELRYTNVFDEESSHKTFIVFEGSASYDALSYSWNNAELVDDLHLRRYEHNKYQFLKRTIVPTGKLIAQTSIRIAQELKSCLLELRRRGYHEWLWVDAICMNQDEIRSHAGVPAASAEVQGVDEFGHHVPLMSDIYGCAKKTVLWLGQLTSDEDATLKKLQSITEIMQKQRELGLDYVDLKQNKQPLTSIGLPNDSDPFWSLLASILDRRWFQRLWTLQEVVLADYVQIVGSSGFVSIKDVLDFVYEAYMFGLSLPMLNKNSQFLSTSGNDIFQCMRDIHQCRLALRMHRGEWYSTAGPAARFVVQKVGMPILLPILQRRICDPAHLEDRSFGALGLISSSSRKRIRVQKGMSCAPLYLAFAQQFVQEAEHPGDCILNYAEGRKQIQGLPSWCPDLSISHSPVSLSQEGYWSGLTKELVQDKTRGFHAGFDLTNETWSPLKRVEMARDLLAFGQRPDTYRSDGPKQLQIMGFAVNATGFSNWRLHATGVRIGHIKETIPFPASDISKGSVRTWEQNCYALYQRTANNSTDLGKYCRTLVARLVSDPVSQEWEQGEKEKETDKRWRLRRGKKEKSKDVKPKRYPPEEDLIDTSFDNIDIVESHRQCIASLTQQSCHETPKSRHANKYLESMVSLGQRRCFFSTEEGNVGLGPVDARPGDEVCVFFFCPTLYVIREFEDKKGSTDVGGTKLREFVGEAFVDGYMRAEALALIDNGEVKEEEWNLL